MWRYSTAFNQVHLQRHVGILGAFTFYPPCNQKLLFLKSNSVLEGWGHDQSSRGVYVKCAACPNNIYRS